jgi:hypothetical protein
MSFRRYHDFTILTDEPGDEPGDRFAPFTVYVFQSPAGEGEKKETVPLEHYDRLRQRRDLLAKRQLDLNEQIAYGRQLAALLLPPYARRLFEDSLHELGPGEGLRVRLRLLRRLAHLPWEYMHLGEAGDAPVASKFMALDPRISIVRHEAIATPPEKTASGNVRRVLIAMATPEPHTKYEPLPGLPDEQQQITAALSTVKGLEVRRLPDFVGTTQWDTLPGASPDQVQATIQELEQVDLFHFSGHGDFAREMAPVPGEYEGAGFLVLADEHNRAVEVSADDLQQLLGKHGIRLVTLGACESGRRDMFNAWSSIPAALLQGQIPSVVAMQFRVRDRFAAAFMAALYQALVAGATVDEAVFSGRAAIRALSYGEFAGDRDWGTPVLYSRVPGGCLFPPVSDEEARREAQRGLDAITGLHQAWWDWTDHRATVGYRRLRYLATLSEEREAQDKPLPVEPAQALLLLRSAVVEGEPVERWLAHLRQAGPALMAGLDAAAQEIATAEETAAAEEAAAAEKAAPTKAEAPFREEATVFDLDGAAQQDRPPGVGPVAWAAVKHDDRPVRHTAALALTALPPVPETGLEHIDAALHGLRSPWKRYARRAELRGALADGDPGIGQANRGLPPWDRFGIWCWRFGQRVFHDWERILLLALGGAVGGFCGLGALRAVVVLFTLGRKNPASYLLMYGYLGFLLGAVLCLGILLAGPVLLRPPRRREQKPEPPGRAVQIAAALLGALFFGLALAALVGLRGIAVTERPLVYLFGFVLGLGLSLALYGLPNAARRPGCGGMLLRAGVAAAVSAAIQSVFLWVPDTGAALDVALSLNFYEAFFRDSVVSPWLVWIALLDAALAGAVLAAGIGWGLHHAGRLARWLQDLRERAGAQ